MKASLIFIPKILFQVFFLLFLLTSCEKNKGIFIDEYAFLKGEWVIEDIKVQIHSGGGYPDNYRSSALKYSYSNDSLESNYKNYRTDNGEVITDISRTTKFAYALQLSIDSSISINAQVSNILKNIVRDTSYTVQYEKGDFDNQQPSLSQPPLEKYSIKIPFGKNRFFIKGIWNDYDDNVLFAKETVKSDSLIFEFTEKISEQESDHTASYYYKFKRKK